MDSFLWWSGVVTWGALAVLGAFFFFDWLVDRIVTSFKFKREFLAWYFEKLKKRSADELAG
jgi:hypothetical protein